MLKLAAALFLLVSPALAAEAPAVPDIPLDKPLVTLATGKPMPNPDDRTPGLEILFGFTDAAGHRYDTGQIVTDAREMQAINAYLTGVDKLAYVGPVDPDCAKCAPITMRWVITQALNTVICAPPPGGQPKSTYCDAEEEKSEKDQDVMLARHNLALAINGTDAFGGKSDPMKTLALAMKYRTQLEKLIGGRFSPPFVPAPALDVIEQAKMAIDPTYKPQQWGASD